MLQARPALGVCFLSQPYFVLSVNQSGPRFSRYAAPGVLKEQNAPRVHFQIESFGMERPGGVQKISVVDNNYGITTASQARSAVNT